MIEIAWGIVAYFITGAIVTRILYKSFDMDEHYAFMVVLLWPLFLVGFAFYGLSRLATWWVSRART